MIHVCLVSDQLIPNVIPVLIENPEKVMLLVSERMASKGLGRRIESLLMDRGFPVDLRKGLPDSGTQGIRDYALDLATDLEAQGEPVVLNATGGNKLMTLALVGVFQECLDPKTRVIYTDTQNHCIETIYPTDGIASSGIPSVLDIPLYLACQGVKLRKSDCEDSIWKERVESRQRLTRYLSKMTRDNASFFGVINGLSSNSRSRVGYRGETLDSPVQWLNQDKPCPSGPWKMALEQAVSLGLIDWDSGWRIEFKDLDSSQYLGGKWLEEYAWLVAQECGFDDFRAGVEVTWEEGLMNRDKARNEFDLLLVHENRMLVVECKTANLYSGPESGQEVVNRLESLGRNAGGLFGSTLLLSARGLPNEVRNRCVSQAVGIRQGEEMRRLKQTFENWKETGEIALVA